MKPLSLALAALLYPLAAHAEDVTYPHANDSYLTAHWNPIKGSTIASVTALTYEGKLGIYRFEDSELGPDWELSNGGLAGQRQTLAFGDPAALRAIEAVIRGPRGAKARPQAPEQLKARIKFQRDLLRAVEAKRKLLAAEIEWNPGRFTAAQSKRIRELEGEIAQIAAAVRRLDEGRERVEPQLDRMIDPSRPGARMKAGFYNAWALALNDTHWDGYRVARTVDELADR